MEIEKQEKKWEGMLNIEADKEMADSKVRMWIIFHGKANKKLLMQLENIILRWHRYSQETPPPVGGAVNIAEIKQISVEIPANFYCEDIAYNNFKNKIKISKKQTFFLEMDLSATRQETIEALIAMIATYAEIICPIEYIIFA